jgi:hypothetical protein
VGRAKKPSKGRITKKRVQATENLPAPVIPQVEVRPERDDEPWDEEGLTIRQRLFVDKLTGEAGGNATQAAELAGYSSENRPTTPTSGFSGRSRRRRGAP